MDKRMKIFIAVFSGVIVGGLLAVSLWQSLSWLGVVIGLLSAGLVSYLSYDWQGVRYAVPQAWQAVTSWRPSKLTLKLHLSRLLIMAAVLSYFVWIVGLPMFTGSLVESEKAKETLVGLSIMFNFFVLVCFLNISCQKILDISPGSWGSDKEKISFNLRFAWVISPIRFFAYWLPKESLKVVWMVLKKIPAAIKVLARFVKYLFILIYSQERLLCGVDAAVFVLVSFLICWTKGVIGNPIAGLIILVCAVCGGLFGVANYEVVSKRWLHLLNNTSEA